MRRPAARSRPATSLAERSSAGRPDAICWSQPSTSPPRNLMQPTFRPTRFDFHFWHPSRDPITSGCNARLPRDLADKSRVCIMRFLADLSYRLASTGRGGRRQEAVALLALVLSWLEEGVDTADLQAAARCSTNSLNRRLLQRVSKYNSAVALAIPRRLCAVTPRWAFRVRVPCANARFLPTRRSAGVAGWRRPGLRHPVVKLGEYMSGLTLMAAKGRGSSLFLAILVYSRLRRFNSRLCGNNSRFGRHGNLGVTL